MSGYYTMDQYVPSNWDELDIETRYQWLEKHAMHHLPQAYREAMRRLIESMRHDLDTSHGLWCVDHQPVSEPHAFHLQHKSITGTTKEPDWSSYKWLTGDEATERE